MPGGFFNFIKDDDNNNSSNNGVRRRKRSLMGRKNQSENDLPRQGEVVVLPENLKTVLLAGTPECWSLSTNHADVLSPSQSDADLLSFASSSVDLDNSPKSQQALVDVDAETTSSQRQRQWQPIQQQQQQASFWPRFNPKSTFTSFSRKNSEVGSIAEEQQQEEGQEQPAPKEPSSMIVTCPSPIPQPPPPQEALNMWLNSVDALLNSHELFTFVNSTRDVVLVVGSMAARTAFLPVTIPLHWAAMTKDFVGHACQQLLRAAMHNKQLITKDEIPSSQTKQEETDKSKEEKEVVATKEGDGNEPLEGLMQLVPLVLGTAGKIKDDIGAVVISLVTPPQPHPQQQQQRSNDRCDNQAALDRLRLPVFTEEEQVSSMVAPQTLTSTSKRHLTRADFTKYLMRVEDMGVPAPGTRNSTVLYIDLSDEYGDRQLMERVLEKLAARGIELTSTHAPAISPSEKSSAAMDIDWKPEGTTAKLLRKRARQTPERWEETLQNDILIWSGTFKQQRAGSVIHGQYPLFLARGIVPNLSPRAFLELFWNDNRTHEYNFYCMGRETVLSIDDELLSSSSSSSSKAHTASKVVKSDTRVPFTSLSVTLLTLMHCRPLPGGPKEGYVIVSRSLVSGMAGYHTTLDKNTVQKSQSEILWGVNVLRPVPNHPEQTELTSLSQVASAMVPKFLSHRIGLMGVEDFFRNIRSPNDSKAACSYDPTGSESLDTTTTTVQA